METCENVRIDEFFQEGRGLTVISGDFRYNLEVETMWFMSLLLILTGVDLGVDHVGYLFLSVVSNIYGNFSPMAMLLSMWSHSKLNAEMGKIRLIHKETIYLFEKGGKHALRFSDAELSQHFSSTNRTLMDTFNPVREIEVARLNREQVIFPQLRKYQKRILDNYDGGSLLIVLPTGCGKTRILMEIAVEHRGTVFICAPKKAICKQHLDDFTSFFRSRDPSATVVLLTKINDKRANNTKVIITTPAILATISIPKGSMLVMDEVHHLRGHSLMAECAAKAVNSKCVLVGATATIGYSRKKTKMSAEFSELLKRMGHPQVVALSKEEKSEAQQLGLLKDPSFNVCGAVDAKPMSEADWLIYLSCEKEGLGAIIERLQSSEESWAELDHLNLSKLSENLNKCLPTEYMNQTIKRFETMSKMKFFHTKTHHRVEEFPENLKSSQFWINKAYFAACWSVTLEMVRLRGVPQDDLYPSWVVATMGPWINHITVNQSVQNLKDHLDGKRAVIVFCNTRLVAMSLYISLYDYLAVRYVDIEVAVGGADGKYKLDDVTQTVSRLRASKNSFILFATNVLEEGIDLSNADCVINFDPVMNFVSHSQSKGRARATNSTHVVLNTSTEMLDELERASRSQQMMLERVENRPQNDVIQHAVYQMLEILKKENNAISRMNEMLQSMKEDKTLDSCITWNGMTGTLQLFDIVVTKQERNKKATKQALCDEWIAIRMANGSG
jgi:ERCC4-related helicase